MCSMLIDRLIDRNRVVGAEDVFEKSFEEFMLSLSLSNNVIGARYGTSRKYVILYMGGFVRSGGREDIIVCGWYRPWESWEKLDPRRGPMLMEACA